MTGKLDGQRFAAGGLAAAILDSAHALVVTLDIEGRITGFNRACELLSGYQADDVIGRYIWERLLPQEAVEPIRRIFAGLPEGGEIPDEFENDWLTRDGRRPIIAWNNSVIRNAAGEIDVIVGIGVDITERKTAASRLARAQRIAKVGNWERTVDTGEEYWSDQFFVNLGLEPGSVEPSAEEFYRHVHPGDRDDIGRMIRNTVERKLTYSTDFRVIRPDGTERLVHEEAEPILDKSGQVIALAGTMQDVTELRETENRLQRLTRSFTNAQRLAGIGNWDWDAVTKAEWWSDEVYRIMGLEPGAIKSCHDNFMERTHPDDREKVEQAIKAAQGQLTSYDIVFRLITPNGEERFVRETGECVLDSLGRLAGLTGAVQDITAQHAVERALADTAGRLEGATRLAKLGSWEWDPDSNLLKNSMETLRICGLQPEHAEVDNNFLMAMIPQDEHAGVLDKMNSAVSGMTAYTNEYHIVRPNGDRRTVFEHGEPFHDDTTGRTRLIGTIQDITERTQVEEELARTVKRLADAQSAAQIGNWEWDAASNRDWWSEQQFRNYGIEAPAGFVPGDYYLEFALPADRDTVKQAVDRSVETGTPLDMEFRAIGADGVERMLWVYGTTETGADGRAIRSVGTTQDITARKYAESELLRTTERLKDAQRIGNIGDWLRDLRDNSEKWSDQSYAIYGLEPGEIAVDGDTYMRFVHPDDRERVQLAHERATSGKTPLSVEYRCIDARGVEKVIQATGECRFDQGGELVAMAGTIQDITDRKRAESELARTAARLEEAQRIAHLGHWEWLPDTTSTLWSDQMFRIFGMEPGEIEPTQATFFKIVHADDREIVSGIMARTIETGEPYEIEFRIIRVDGVLRYIFERGERYIDEETGKSSVRGVMQDVTERKQIEQELARLNAELERRVEDRTAELRAAQAELVKNERLATLGQLTATVSHELRNPLGAMRTSMYVIDKKLESEDPRLRASIERVNRNITRCDQIIDELLDYTRIRDLDLREADIDRWLGAVLDEQDMAAGITVKRNFGAKGTRVPFDDDRLRRAFINIFENACHAVIDPHNANGAAHRPLISVETSLRKNRVQISVSDNGAGIPTEIREKIFEPLFSTKNFGVGLGLPTVRQIMEQHGGGIEIGESRDGGAEFALWLPLAGESETAGE